MSDLTKTEEKPKSRSVKNTTACFNKALEILGIDKIDREARIGRKPEIGREYIRLVRTLPEWMLTEIIEEHENGILLREDSTIEEILDELALRILLKESNHGTHLPHNA